MKRFIPILKNSKLFAGISEDEITPMLSCLSARLFNYNKGEYVFRRGEQISDIGILVSGKLHVQKDDFWGNRVIVRQIPVGGMFGEAYVSPESALLLNDVVATEDSCVIMFDAKRVITTCQSSCRFHAAVVQNLFYCISEENKNLMRKIGHITKRSTREKLLSYLSEEAQKQSASSFSIPFNRQELADYLSVDRSAMSNELCKMRDEGLLQFDRNHFTLL